MNEYVVYNYPRLDGLMHEQRHLTEKIKQAIRKEFPISTRVVVDHARGSFSGTVEGGDDYRVLVKNDRTGKMAYWWYAHVRKQGAHPSRRH